MTVFRNKATANGAVAYYLDRKVYSKKTRAAYGTINFLTYDPENPIHFARRGRVKEHAGGQLVLPLYFGVLVKKVSVFEQPQCGGLDAKAFQGCRDPC